MKILKPGNLKVAEKIKKFECKECGCIFEANKNEYKIDYQYNDGYYISICPTCGYPCVHEEEEK